MPSGRICYVDSHITHKSIAALNFTLNSFLFSRNKQRVVYYGIQRERYCILWVGELFLCSHSDCFTFTLPQITPKRAGGKSSYRGIKPGWGLNIKLIPLPLKATVAGVIHLSETIPHLDGAVMDLQQVWADPRSLSPDTASLPRGCEEGESRWVVEERREVEIWRRKQTGHVSETSKQRVSVPGSIERGMWWGEEAFTPW